MILALSLIVESRYYDVYLENTKSSDNSRFWGKMTHPVFTIGSFFNERRWKKGNCRTNQKWKKVRGLGPKLPIFVSTPRFIAGWFFAPFKKTQGRLQKNSRRFLAKNSRVWRQLWISRKNSIFFDKSLQNSFKSSKNLNSFWRIFPKFEQFMWNFSTKQRNFPKYFLGIR